MIAEIASILKTRIQDLPFIDLIGGLVQTVTETQPIGEGETKKVKFPVAYDITANCGNNPEANQPHPMIPEHSRRSIFYFEDYGTSSQPARTPSVQNFVSNLRLVAWINNHALFSTTFEDNRTQMMTMILQALGIGGNPTNAGNFRRMSISVTRLPVADASLFSKYNYDETIIQYLMPPYSCFAIDLAVKYEVSSACIPNVVLNPSIC